MSKENSRPKIALYMHTVGRAYRTFYPQFVGLGSYEVRGSNTFTITFVTLPVEVPE